MRIFFFYFAVLGWFLSLILQLLLFADVDVQSQYSFTWLLHVGVFVVWIPSILLLRKDNKECFTLKSYNPITFWRFIFKDTPVWLIVIAMGGFLYAWVSFMLHFISIDGVVSIIDGQYVIHNHGSIIKVLTEQEYHYYHIKEQISFSGIWLTFYGIAMAILYPFNTSKIVESDLIAE